MPKRAKKQHLTEDEDILSTKVAQEEASSPVLINEDELDQLIAEVEDSAGVERSVKLKELPTVDDALDSTQNNDVSHSADNTAHNTDASSDLSAATNEPSNNADAQDGLALFAAAPEVLSNNDEDSQDKKAAPKWLKPLLLSLAAVVGILAGLYFGGVAFFTQNTLPNTIINGRDMSMKSADDVASVFGYELSKWTSNIEGNGVHIPVTASDIGLATDTDAYANYVLSSTNPWKWPVELFNTHSYSIELRGTADKDKVAAFIDPYLEENNQQLDGIENGGIFYNEEAGEYQVPDEILRGRIDQNAVVDKIIKEITNLPSSFVLGDEVLTQNDFLVSALDEANTILASAPITLQMAGETIYEIEKEQLVSWLGFDEDLHVVVNEEALDEWTHGPLCEYGDTLNYDRSFTRADGKEIVVPGGTYGWMVDSSAVTAQIIEHLHDGEPVTLATQTLSEADHFNPHGREWDSYIDVDLTEQHVRWYDDNDTVIWEADCVTGQPVGKDFYGATVSYATPKGVYFINNKETNKKMRGPWIPELNNYEYESPADLWLPFLHDSWALHDSAWRYEYGGNIYTWYGSHGCVNIAKSNLQELFDNVQVGEPVVVHD